MPTSLAPLLTTQGVARRLLAAIDAGEVDTTYLHLFSDENWAELARELDVPTPSAADVSWLIAQLGYREAGKSRRVFDEFYGAVRRAS